MRALIIAMCVLLPGCALEKNQQRFNQPLVPPAGTLPVQAEPAPPQLDRVLVERGRGLFGVYCAPCHGLSGRGDGEVVRRGFLAPPDLAGTTLDAGGVWSVVTNGAGAMYPYRDRMDSQDRWAVAHYVQVLKLTRQPVPLESLPADLRRKAGDQL